MLDNKKQQISFNIEALLNDCCAKVHNNSVQIYFCISQRLSLVVPPSSQGERLPDCAIGSGNERRNVPDIAMNANQQEGVPSQEPFYSSLNTTKPAVKVAAPVTTARGDYAKINQVR